MAYLGNTPTTQGFIPAIDFFSGNASTTAFTLSRPVASVAQVQAVIENVPQNPGDAFTVSGNTITFTSAPPSGTNNIYVYYTSPITQVIQPGQGTVGATQVDGNFALWNKSGSDISYTAGNVGVGTSTGITTVSSGLAINNATAGNYPGLEIQTAGVTRLFLNANNAESYVSSAGTNPLVFYTNSAERMRIDSAGRVTMPFQPLFDVSYSGSAISSGVIPFNIIRSNVGSNYNSANGRFTAPINGYYEFKGVFLNSSGSSLEVLFELNGSINRRWYSGVSTYNNIAGSAIILLNAGDYMTCTVGSGSMFGSDATYLSFNGRLIG
jgi:hypothetical protein